MNDKTLVLIQKLPNCPVGTLFKLSIDETFYNNMPEFHHVELIKSDLKKLSKEEFNTSFGNFATTSENNNVLYLNFDISYIKDVKVYSFNINEINSEFFIPCKLTYKSMPNLDDVVKDIISQIVSRIKQMINLPEFLTTYRIVAHVGDSNKPISKSLTRFVLNNYNLPVIYSVFIHEEYSKPSTYN